MYTKMMKEPEPASKPLVSVDPNGGVNVTHVHHHAAPDELVPFPFGLEAAAATKLVKSGVLKAAKIGRKLFARRSDLLALVDRLASTAASTMKETTTEDTYAAAVVALAGRRKIGGVR